MILDWHLCKQNTYTVYCYIPFCSYILWSSRDLAVLLFLSAVGCSWFGFPIHCCKQWRHGGGAWGNFPPSQRLCPPPTCPQSEEKNGQNQPFSAIFWIFAPSMPPHKKIFWCRHWLQVLASRLSYYDIWLLLRSSEVGGRTSGFTNVVLLLIFCW